jgi:hypothetical protein
MRALNRKQVVKDTLTQTSGAGGNSIPQPVHHENMKGGFVTRERFLLLVGLFVLELVVFFAATATPLSQATGESLRQSAGAICPHDAPPLQTTACIFSHNLFVALTEMIPGVGALVFLYSIFITGQAIQAIALPYGVPATFYGALLLVFPFTIVELSAYVLAVESGSMIIVASLRKRLRKEAEVFVIEIFGVAVMLLLAAAMETTTELSPGFSLALWLPLGLLIAWLAIALTRGLKKESIPSPPTPFVTPLTTASIVGTTPVEPVKGPLAKQSL